MPRATSPFTSKRESHKHKAIKLHHIACNHSTSHPISSSHHITRHKLSHTQYTHPMPVHKTASSHTSNAPYTNPIHIILITQAIPHREKTQITIMAFRAKIPHFNTSPSSHPNSSYSLLSPYHQSHHVTIRLMASQIHSKIPIQSPQTHAKHTQGNCQEQSTVWGQTVDCH